MKGPVGLTHAGRSFWMVTWLTHFHLSMHLSSERGGCCSAFRSSPGRPEPWVTVLSLLAGPAPMTCTPLAAQVVCVGTPLYGLLVAVARPVPSGSEAAMLKTIKCRTAVCRATEQCQTSQLFIGHGATTWISTMFSQLCSAHSSCVV